MIEPFLIVRTGTCVATWGGLDRSGDGVFSRPRPSSSDRGTGGKGNH